MKERIALPYCPLDEKLLSIGFNISEKTDENKQQYISIPTDSSHLQFIKEIPIYSELAVKFLNQNDINEGKIRVPHDAYNLANFDDSAYTSTNGGTETLMPLLNGIFDRLHISDNTITRNQLIFSASEQTIYIFPRFLK
jgi:hypothetical protein